MFNFEAFWQTLTEQTVLLGPKILFAFTTLFFWKLDFQDDLLGGAVRIRDA